MSRPAASSRSAVGLWKTRTIAMELDPVFLSRLQFAFVIIFMYIGWSYYVFRGKVTSHDGYH